MLNLCNPIALHSKYILFTETKLHKTKMKNEKTWSWMKPSSWLRIWRERVPCKSKLRRPPFLSTTIFSLSSMVIVIGSVGGRTDFDWTALGCTSSVITSPSALSDSKNWFVFCVFLPSCIPSPFGGALADAAGRSADFFLKKMNKIFEVTVDWLQAKWVHRDCCFLCLIGLLLKCSNFDYFFTV
jgi:hypothetical protein